MRLTALPLVEQVIITLQQMTKDLSEVFDTAAITAVMPPAHRTGKNRNSMTVAAASFYVPSFNLLLLMTIVCRWHGQAHELLHLVSDEL